MLRLQIYESNDFLSRSISLIAHFAPWTYLGLHRVRAHREMLFYKQPVLCRIQKEIRSRCCRFRKLLG